MPTANKKPTTLLYIVGFTHFYFIALLYAWTNGPPLNTNSWYGNTSDVGQ
jgi:hypothetical protein